MEKHTILFLAANPLGTDRLALDQEAKAIQTELEYSGYRDCFVFMTRWAAEPIDLLRELRKMKPAVVHFSGHGGARTSEAMAPTRAGRRDVADHAVLGVEPQHGLYFQGPDGEAQWVSPEALAQTFGAAGASVKLVILNACYSDTQATALLSHIPCVVGMAGSIGDRAARNFAIGFYGGLGEGESVAKAYEQGQAAISLMGLRATERPQLRARTEVDASQLVLAANRAGITAPVAEASRAAHVTRRVTLDPDNGVAKIEVEIDDLDLSEPIVLAQIASKFCTAPDASAMVDGERLPVTRRAVGNSFEYRSNAWTAKHYHRLTWSYRIANAFALTRTELTTKRDEFPHLLDGWELWSHRVQFDHDRLTLEFVFDALDGEYFGGVGGPLIVPIVERSAKGGPLVVERVASEENRAIPNFASVRKASMSWASPIANARYGMTFPLANAGNPLPRKFAVATTKLVQLCRSTRNPGNGLRNALSTYLVASLERALELSCDQEAFGEHAVAVGNLWSETEALLLPCFGFFLPDTWGTQFEAGRGIAGHAFRFVRPTAWHRSITGEFDVIRVPTMTGTRDDEWILCLPIRTSPDGTAIGVFGFAGTRDHNTETTNHLAAFAQQIAQRDPTVDTDAFN